MSRQVQFKSGNQVSYGQGFVRRIGVPDGVLFTIEMDSNFQIDGVWRLVADGYGMLGKPNSYGNGALYVSARDVSVDDLVSLATKETVA